MYSCSILLIVLYLFWADTISNSQCRRYFFPCIIFRAVLKYLVLLTQITGSVLIHSINSSLSTSFPKTAFYLFKRSRTILYKNYSTHILEIISSLVQYSICQLHSKVLFFIFVRINWLCLITSSQDKASTWRFLVHLCCDPVCFKRDFALQERNRKCPAFM